MPVLKYYDSGPMYKKNPSCVHGRTVKKDLIVLHETISPDIQGLTDITGVINYLISKDYGIHGMTDKEGNIAWAKGYGNAIFWQCGGVNERSIGIEQVSKPPSNSPSSIPYWKARSTQLRATAKLVGSICKTWGVPLRYSDGDSSGITTHWSVSQIYSDSEGHWDCHPIHHGGYYPALDVIRMAKAYYLAGYRLV